LHFHSAVTQRTNVSFSSATFNALQKMALGAQRSNLMSVPTDCDQRDERLGWMGDANLSGDSMALNFDLASFLKFFIIDMSVEIGPDGSLPDTVPFARYGGRPGDVSWTAALATVVNAVFETTGDVSVIHQALPDMLKQLDNVKGQAANGLAKMHTPYGDWCPPPAKLGGGQGSKPTPPYTSAFAFLDMVQKMQVMASKAGNSSVATRLTTLATKLASEFNDAFFHSSNSSYDNGIQTANVLALKLGISPNVSGTEAALLSSLQAAGMHYDTGIIGFKFIFDALKMAGFESAAETVLSQLDYPSIGFFFANKAEKASTNLWELPDVSVFSLCFFISQPSSSSSSFFSLLSSFFSRLWRKALV
jgi:alpha-L-rhamnosidase